MEISKDLLVSLINEEIIEELLKKVKEEARSLEEKRLALIKEEFLESELGIVSRVEVIVLAA